MLYRFSILEAWLGLTGWSLVFLLAGTDNSEASDPVYHGRRLSELIGKLQSAEASQNQEAVRILAAHSNAEASPAAVPLASFLGDNTVGSEARLALIRIGPASISAI